MLTFMSDCQNKKCLRRILSLTLAMILLASFLTVFVSCGEDDMGPTYMTVGSADVPYDVVRCFVKQSMSLYSEKELAKEEVRQKIRDSVIDQLKSLYVIRSLAKENGVRLDDNAKKNIEAIMKEYRKIDGYKEMLKDTYSSDAIIKELESISYLDTLLYDFLCDFNERFDDSVETIDADLESGRWYAAEYVVLLYDDVNHDARKAEMEDARKAILAGESLQGATAKLKSRYQTEYYYITDGCFTDTIYPEDFENTVKGLEERNVGTVIDTFTSEGYACLMLIRRLPVSREYVEDHYDTVKANYLARVYTEYMEEQIDAIQVVIKEAYAKDDLLDIK